MPKPISVEGDGHCCHRPSSNWETNQVCLTLLYEFIHSFIHNKNN